MAKNLHCYLFKHVISFLKTLGILLNLKWLFQTNATFVSRANQDAQEELIELRREVGEFVRSVLNNPDNQNRTKQAT